MLSTHQSILTTLTAIKTNITSTKKFRDILPNCSFDTCVILDCDNTLVKPTNEIASDQMFDALLQYVTTHFNDPGARALVIDICHAMQFATSMSPVEPAITARIVRILQDVGIPTLLVTARGADLIEITENQLREIGINFSTSWPKKTITLDSVTSENNIEVPIYKNGMIFSSGKRKVECVEDFFNKINYHPKHIVMADDKRHHLEAMEEKYQRFNGLHYQYLDEEVAEFKSKFDLQTFLPKLENALTQCPKDQEEAHRRAKNAINILSKVHGHSIFMTSENTSITAEYSSIERQSIKISV